MQLDLSTFLTVVYTIVDDLYRTYCAPAKPTGPGRKPTLSDSEVLTLLLLAQWDRSRRERAVLRYARRHWLAYFPHLLSQSAFNKRARHLVGVVAALGPRLGDLVVQALGEPPVYEAIDGVPVPVMRRCRGDQHRCFTDEAGIGIGGSDKDWYYGVRLVPVVTNQGVITGFVIGPAPTSERWLAEALFRWRVDPTLAAPTAAELAPVLGPSHHGDGSRQGPTGPIWPALGAGKAVAPICLADLGFKGVQWIEHWREAYGVIVQTKAAFLATADAAAREALAAQLARLRQVVETVQGVLTDTFGLAFPRARSGHGLVTRLAAKVAAFNLALYINQLFDRPLFSMPSPFD